MKKIIVFAIVLFGFILSGCANKTEAWTYLGDGEATGAFMLDGNNAWIACKEGNMFIYDGKSWNSKEFNSFNLTDVWAARPEKVWATGKASKAEKVIGGIYFYNGRKWALTKKTPGQRLYGLTGIDASHIWAVGDSGTILFFDGRDWIEQASGVKWNIKDIWAYDPSHVWAVGSGGILFFDGNTWHTQFKKEADGIFTGLNSIDGFDQNHIWAAGSVDGDAFGSILFFDGKGWQTQVKGRTLSEINKKDRVVHVTEDIFDETYASVYAANISLAYVISKNGLYVYNGNKWREKSINTNGVTPTIVFGFEAAVFIAGYTSGYDSPSSTSYFDAWLTETGQPALNTSSPHTGSRNYK